MAITNSAKKINGENFLKKIASFSKGNLTYDQIAKGLHFAWDGLPIENADYDEWLLSLGDRVNDFLKITYKSQADLDNIAKSIAEKTPKGKLPSMRMIDSAFIDPKNFKASVIDVAVLTAKAGAEAIKKGSEAVVGTANFLAKGKWLILAGILGYVGYRLLSEANKFKSSKPKSEAIPNKFDNR